MQRAVILVSANGEWQAVQTRWHDQPCLQTPFGGQIDMAVNGWQVTLLQGGWGKVSAAASAQYAIDHFKPDVVINLGTSGGFEGLVNVGDVLLVTETVAYDIVERMSDPAEALAHYTTRLDLSWLAEPLPIPVRRGRMLSADRDIDPADIPWLRREFEGVAADWESAAIAWVAARNRVRCLILRVVSDVVGEHGSDCYDAADEFNRRAGRLMNLLLDSLPAWLDCCKSG